MSGSLDKKVGRRFHLSSIFCLIKDGTLFPLFCLTNQALVCQYLSTIERFSSAPPKICKQKFEHYNMGKNGNKIGRKTFKNVV
jgi:hypothetical protein